MIAIDTPDHFEVAQIAELLEELSQVQTGLLDLLQEKQRRMASREAGPLADLLPREEELVQRMQACYERRTALLDQAGRSGLPNASLSDLTGAVEQDAGPLAQRVKDSRVRMRLLQHHSLANWVLAQQTLLHVAQLLEIIATGGRMQPTYGSGASPLSRGNLLNSEA